MHTVFSPYVSVWVLTYNHARFISQCLDGILAQRTNFSFEICLGEDDSSDGTRQICQGYAAKYPELIRLFLRDRNDPFRAGCAGEWQYNFIETFKSCRGKYVAMCDGDDFWDDPKKLQKQIDYLESHPEYSGCFHKVGLVDENGRQLCPDMGYPPIRQSSYSLDFLLRYSNFSPMFSVVFRNHGQIAPDWVKQAPFGDMIVHANNLLRGDYGFIDEVMGFYRIHSGGLASGTSRLNNIKSTFEVYRLLGENLRLNERSAFNQGILALKMSFLFEWIMRKMLPHKIKQRFDKGIGIKVRSLARRVLMFGYDRNGV